jgi:photosystem II stability/assembly factor-like uncharacterized protein
VTSGVYTPLDDVFGSGPKDVWAIGETGVMLHYDGTAWSPALSGTTRHLRNMTMATSGEGWIVGEHGLVLHRPPPK